MRNNASLLYSFFLVVGDFIAILLAFAVAYIVRFRVFETANIASVSGRNFIYALYATIPLWILVHALIGLYKQDVYERRFTEFGRLFSGAFFGTLVIIGYNFMADEQFLPGRLVPVYGFALSFLFLVIFRQVARWIRGLLFSLRKGINTILIVGDTPVSVELVEQLIDWRHSGYQVLGVVSKNGAMYADHPEVPVYETFAEALETIGVENISSIVQTELYAAAGKNNEILTTAQENHIAYRFVPGNSELFVGNIQVDLFHSVPVIAVHQTALLGWGRVVKRIFDIIFGGILLVLTSPIMLLIAVMIKLTGGSVFFRQTRLTRFNQEFRVFKFRTQYPKYDGTTPEEAFALMGKPELAQQYRENGDQLARDPRVTPLGRFLRASSLDELPQLINVVRGDLSLVGPRALIPQELATFKKRHAILSVKSGMTGLAQVSGRRNISFDERRKLDLYYAQNWTFWLDMTILLKTFRAVVSGKGAK